MDLIHAIIADFKQRRTQLREDALAQGINGTTGVFYEYGPYGIQAYYEPETNEFVELIADHRGGPLPGEPSVIYTIHPPKGEKW
jgi:hypothetical protein